MENQASEAGQFPNYRLLSFRYLVKATSHPQETVKPQSNVVPFNVIRDKTQKSL